MRPSVHLVGSVAMSDSESVFRALSSELTPWLRRIPDGETGERHRWIYWQREMLLSHPDMEIDPEFEDLSGEYLADVTGARSEHKGWKLPETTLIYPWIVRMFPDIKYIHWIRDPRDSILSGHKTDDLSDFGIEYEWTDNIRQRRAISWKYQNELMRATPKHSSLLDCAMRITMGDSRRTW